MLCVTQKQTSKSVHYILASIYILFDIPTRTLLNRTRPVLMVTNRRTNVERRRSSSVVAGKETGAAAAAKTETETAGTAAGGGN